MLFTKKKKVLLQNPCGIGAVASFLGNTSILNKDIIPPGSEFLNSNGMRANDILQDSLYSMG